MENNNFIFNEINENEFKTFNNKEYIQLFEKWGLSSIISKSYNFTGEITLPFDSNKFLLNFLNTKGISIEKIENIEFETLTTNSTGKNFWKKLWTSPNNIIRNSSGHYISKCPDHHIKGMWLSDLLQVAIFDEDSEEFKIFTKEDRKELLFHIMKFCVIGGEICQYEDEWDIYEPIITSLYKDLIGQSIVKNSSGSLTIISRAFLLTKINNLNISNDLNRSFYIIVIDSISKKIRILKFLTLI